MEMVEIVVKVPKSFVDDATEFGLINPQTIMDVLQTELDNRIMQFVDAEVKAYRAEERAKRTERRDV
jgi:hypothetical protein